VRERLTDAERRAWADLKAAERTVERARRRVMEVTNRQTALERGRTARPSITLVREPPSTAATCGDDERSL